MKARILACSMEIFGKYGIKGLTMDNIAAEVGISKRTLYEHFSCKEELLTECLRLRLNSCKLFTNTTEGLIDELFTLYKGMREINLGDTHRFCLELQKFHDPLYRLLRGWLLDYASACSEKVKPDIANGYIRRDVHASTVCTAIAGYLNRLFSGFETNYPDLRTILSPEIILVFTRGLCTIKGRDYLDKKIKELAL